MSSRALSPITYIIIDAILVLFTILTVALSFVPGSAAAHMAYGLVIAVLKASLVVLFFMHVLQSPAQTRAVIVITVFWLVAVLGVLTFSDYLTRGILPNLPGH
jgi:cytochrome c oxidase subunit IV